MLIREAGADNLVQRSGYHSLHRTQAALDRAALVAETLAAEYGVRSQIIGAAQLAAAEPGLNETGAGAIHWRDPWTVSDPGGLVAAYADLFTRAGGTFVNGDATTLAQNPAWRGWTVQSDDGPIDAEAAVVALGPWSPDLLQKFGYRFPMVRKRGYHRHFSGGGKLDLPLHDPAFGYAVAPMAKGLRITTGAELTGPSMSARPLQLERAEQAARELVDLGTAVEAEPWSGVRPCMPDMLPVVGTGTEAQGPVDAFRAWSSGFYAWPHDGPPAGRTDERRATVHRCDGVQPGALLIPALRKLRQESDCASIVVPANAGTITTRALLLEDDVSHRALMSRSRGMGPCASQGRPKKRAGSSIRPFNFIADRESSRRLHQAFLDERFLHLRARADAGLVGHQVRQAGEIPFHPFGP